MGASQVDIQPIIEEVLGILGADNISVLYQHLARLGVSRDEIADKPAAFSKALRMIFGQAATMLERQIVSGIASKTGIEDGQKLTLAEAMQKLKKQTTAH